MQAHFNLAALSAPLPPPQHALYPRQLRGHNGGLRQLAALLAVEDSGSALDAVKLSDLQRRLTRTAI